MIRVDLGSVTITGNSAVSGVAIFEEDKMTVMSNGFSITFAVVEASEEDRLALSGKTVKVDSSGAVGLDEKKEKPAKQSGCSPSRQVI